MADQTTEEMLEQMREQTKILGSMNTSSTWASRNLDAIAKKLGAAAAAADDAADSIDDLDSSADRASGSVSDFQRATDRTTLTLKNAARDISRISSSFVDSLSKGEKGIAIYQNALSSGASVVGDTLAKFGGAVGVVAGSLVKAAGAIVGASLAQSKDLAEAHRDLAKFGGAVGDGTRAVFDNLHMLKLTSAEYGKFVRVVGANSQTLAMYGNTTAQGIKYFAEVSKAMAGDGDANSIRMQMLMLGYREEELMDAMGSVMELQLKAGRIQKKTAESQGKSVLNFVKNLDEASRLTGMSSQNLTEQARSRLGDASYGAYQAYANRQGGKMALGAQEIEKLTMVLQAVDPSLGQGVSHLAASNFTNEATKVMLSLPAMQKVIGEVRSGDMTATDALTTLKQDLEARHEREGKGRTFEEFASTFLREQSPGLSIQTSLAYANFIRRFDPAKALDEQRDMLNPKNDTFKNIVNLEETTRRLGIGVDSATAYFEENWGITGWLKRIADGVESVLDWIILNVPSLADKETIDAAQERTDRRTAEAERNQMAEDAIREKARLDKEMREKAAAEREAKVQEVATAASSPVATPSVMSPVATPSAMSPPDAGSAAGGRFANLLQKISLGEGTTDEQARKHGYASGDDVVYGYGQYGSPDKPLSEMTIAEVQEYQRKQINATRGHVPGQSQGTGAVGRFQVTHGTLETVIQQLGLTPDTVFSGDLQTQIGEHLVKQRIGRLLADPNVSVSSALNSISKEWASLKNSRGVGAYEGQRGSVDVSNELAALAGTGFRTGGIASGPSTGHMQLLHGTEAIIPLPDGKSIPVHIAGPNTSYSTITGNPKIDPATKAQTQDINAMTTRASEQISLMQMQMAKFDELIYQMQKNVAISEKLLQKAQQA